MTEELPKEVVRTAILKSQQKTVHIDPRRCLPAINPRSLQELEWEDLLSPILTERGVVHTNLLVWKIPPTDKLWDEIGNGKFANLPHEERELSYITIQGHRRTAATVHIVENPTKYPADIVENASTVPATVLEGITLERAEELALDDDARKSLKAWEIVRVVLKRYHKDYSRQRISIENPEMLYRALLGNGQGRYTEVSKIDDGRDRQQKYIKDLRNPMDTHIKTCFLVGPAAEEQLLYYFKRERDKRELLEGERLLVDFKYDNVRQLREVFNKSRTDSYIPVTRIDWDDTEGPIVTGGTPEVNSWLKKNIREKRNPEIKDVEKPKLPNKGDRENVRTSVRSNVGKLTAAFFCGLPSENRQEEEDKAYFREEREKVLSLVENATKEYEVFTKALKEERNMEVFLSICEGLNATIRSKEEAEKRADDLEKALEAARKRIKSKT